ncbi:MAG: hypothetical protein ACRCZP_07710, partial [Phycicoccus sp.]
MSGMAGRMAGAAAGAARMGAGLIAIGGAASAAASGLGAVGSAAAAVAAASGALLLLPAAAAGAGVAVGALKIATSGFGAALAEVGDPAAFAEAIAELSPAAQESARAVAGLRPQFVALQDLLQEELFTGLGPRITAAGSMIMTTMGGAFQGVAGDASVALGDVFDLVASRGLDVTVIGQNGAIACSQLSEAAAPLAAVLLDVTAVGADFLPGLTGGAGAAAQAFAEFIGAARESGQLGEWMSTGL